MIILQKNLLLLFQETQIYKSNKKESERKTNNIFTFGEKEDCYSTFKINKNNKILFSTLENQIDLEKKTDFKNWEINISIILIILKILKLDLTKFEFKFEKLKPLSGRGQIKKVKKDSKFLFD